MWASTREQHTAKAVGVGNLACNPHQPIRCTQPVDWPPTWQPIALPLRVTVSSAQRPFGHSSTGRQPNRQPVSTSTIGGNRFTFALVIFQADANPDPFGTRAAPLSALALTKTTTEMMHGEHQVYPQRASARLSGNPLRTGGSGPSPPPLCPRKRKHTAAARRRHILVAFCRYTSMRGLQHVVRSKGCFPRTIWGVFVFFMFLANVVLITLLLIRYHRFNTVEVIRTQVGVRVEFPSVTLCNMDPINTERIKLYADGDHSLPDPMRRNRTIYEHFP